MVRRRDIGLVHTETNLYLVISATASRSVCNAVGMFSLLIEDLRLAVVPATRVES